MSIASVISSMETNISNAYNKISDKGGTVPANKNLANLVTAIDSISGGAADDKPFYFTSASAFTVSMDLTYADPNGTMQYSTDGTNWSSYTSGTTVNGSANGKVYFRGKKYTHLATSLLSLAIFTFSATTKVYVHGNVLRLLDYSLVESGDSLSISLGSYCFFHLFYNQTLLDVGNTFILPSGTLSSYCYDGMFNGCISLTTAPTLPATTTQPYCYSYMFAGCTSLTTAPTLPAITSQSYCYESMFRDCTSLTTAPTLPATTLGSNCYQYMFYGCTSLTTAPTLPVTTLASGCYSNMFNGCTSLTTAPTLPATSLSSSCYSKMFNGCTSLTTAPTLPAITSQTLCYESMFRDCTSLTTAPTLPATTLAQSCYLNMFNGCTSLTVPSKIGDGTTSYTYKISAMQQMFYGCTSLHIYTSNQGSSTAFFKGLSATTSNSMKSMFYNCYIDNVQQTTGDGVVGQQYYY